MKIYQTDNKTRVRWVFGLILFLLALGLTTASVEGFTNTPRGTNRYNSSSSTPQTHNSNSRSYTQSHYDYGIDGKNDGDNPPQVPEPTTMLLLGSGIAAAFAFKRMVK